MLLATTALLQAALARFFFLAATGGGPGLRPGLGPPQHLLDRRHERRWGGAVMEIKQTIGRTKEKLTALSAKVRTRAQESDEGRQIFGALAQGRRASLHGCEAGQQV